MWPQIFQLLKYQWSEGKFDTLGKSGSAHRAQGTPPSKGSVPSGRWGAVGRLPTLTHPPGGPQSLLAGGRASEAFRRPPTGQEGHLPPREVSLPPGGQNPITLEYQIYPPTIDTLVTGMTWTAFAILPTFFYISGTISSRFFAALTAL